MTAGAPGAGRRRVAQAGPPEESPDSAGQGARAGRCGIPAANAGKGKCHRNQTATVRKVRGKGETAVQETTVRRPRGSAQGKPRPEQGQIGTRNGAARSVRRKAGRVRVGRSDK